MESNEETIKGYKKRIKVSEPLVNERTEELKIAEQKLKDGLISKEGFLRVVNNHTEHRQMTVDEFNSLPLTENVSKVISKVKTTDSSNAQLLKAYLGPYRTRKQIVKDENINVAAIIVGTLNDHNVIRYKVEKVDIIRDEY